LIEQVRLATSAKRFGFRLPLKPMLLAAGAVEDLSGVLQVDPPIYRRRMDFFWSDSAFDISRAKRVLDWTPRVDLPEGIRRTAEAYRAAGLIV
jgi:nucleoside-diphosphate-sugar epimerase